MRIQCLLHIMHKTSQDIHVFSESLGLNFHPHPYFVYASSKGSAESAKTDLRAPLLLNNVKCIKITFMFVDFSFITFLCLYICIVV